MFFKLSNYKDFSTTNKNFPIFKNLKQKDFQEMVFSMNSTYDENNEMLYRNCCFIENKCLLLSPATFELGETTFTFKTNIIEN